jgi:Mg-chelatase subunit ChlD
MLGNALDRLARLAPLALLGVALAGCGSYSPTLPSPGGAATGTGRRTFLLRTDPRDPTTAIVGATRDQFTVREGSPGGTLSVRPITCFAEEVGVGTVADVAVVLDRSRSMGTSIEPGKPGAPDRLTAAKKAAQVMVGLMGPGHRAEVIQFDHTVQVLQPLTSDHALLNAAIGGIALGNSTSVWDAAKRGLDDLIAGGRTDVPRGVILLSDGRDNFSKTTPAALIAAAQAAKIPIFAIAVGADADRPTLQKIAADTRARFIQADSAAELEAAFRTIFRRLVGNRYRICWSSAFRDGTVVEARIVYREGTPKEIVAFRGKVTIGS